MINEEKLGAYFVNVFRLHSEHPTWRLGQAFFNALQEVNPSAADEVRGTVCDPCYSDARLTLFFHWLEQNKERHWR